MNKRLLFRAGTAIVALLGAAATAWFLSLPPTADAATPQPVPAAERTAALGALKPVEGRRPLIAVIGINDATEITDYLMTYGILRRANVADVVLLSTQPGPVKLFPALKVEAQATIAQFDRQHIAGADYVIVPQMSRADDPAVMKWLNAQSAKGAKIIGVCAGARIVAAAGLLDGKQATTHWYYLDEMLGNHPSIRYVPDRRLVVDGGVTTTTGITASMPMMLTLIEAIAGQEKATAVARDLGVATWDARHASSAFRLTRPFVLAVVGNRARFWKHEQLGIRLRPGMDEVSLALVADAWSRTYRSNALTFADSAAAVPSKNGIGIIPDRLAADAPNQRLPHSAVDRPPALALDQALGQIGARYGRQTERLVAMQLEYPRP